jgi:predicted hydrolase (HD superfamily)
MDNQHNFAHANADPLSGGKRFLERLHCFYCSKKKWKDKAFAAGVVRDDVVNGCQVLGMDLWEFHVPLVLKAMQDHAEELGLAGTS